ncbi:MAG: S8/S53 family peptidase [Bacteroidota bacterium]
MQTLVSFITKANLGRLPELKSLLYHNLNIEFIHEVISESADLLKLTPDRKVQVDEGKVWDFIHELPTDIAEFLEPTFGQLSDNISTQGGLISCEAHPVGTDDTYWSLKQLRIKEAWDYSKSQGRQIQGAGIKIGHTDTGYTRHESIYHQGLLVNEGYNYFDNINDAYDRIPTGGMFTNHGHGTSTGSLIIGNGKHGILGAAPRSLLVPIRIDHSVITSNENFIRGVQHAISKGCQITSTSMGVVQVGHSQSVDAILRTALNNGIIPVAAGAQAGGFTFDVQPASSSYAISCTASTVGRHPWSKAWKSRRIDVAAPGESVNVATVTPSNDRNLTEKSCGTSYSTALTAASVALWYAHWGVNYIQSLYGKSSVFSVFKNVMQGYAINGAGWNTAQYGPGILDVEALLKAPVASKAFELQLLNQKEEESTGFEILKRKLANQEINVSDEILDNLATKPSLLAEVLSLIDTKGESSLKKLFKHDEVKECSTSKLLFNILNQK